MLKSNDRFARQNRCRHPPEFPLASSCSSIVHHLSGPSTPALPPPHRQADRTGRRCARAKARDLASAGLTDLHFRFARGAKRTPFDSRACWTPWSVFQDGSDENPARTRWTQGAEVRRTPPARSMPSRPQRAVIVTTPSKRRGHPAPRRGPARRIHGHQPIFSTQAGHMFSNRSRKHRPAALLPGR